MFVLVLEDDQDFRDALVEDLSERGHEVVAVADGTQMIEAARQQRPDVILAGVRPDGIDAVKNLHIPAILLTAYDDAGTMSRASQAGVPVLVKPVSFAEIDTALCAKMAQNREVKTP